MNKRIMAVAILTLVLTPTFQTLRAEMKEHGHGKRHEMKEKLGLSEDQEKKLADLRTAEKAELKPLHEKNKAVVEKLKGQIQSKDSDANIKTTLDELKANRESMKQVALKYRESRAAILTPTQQAKMIIAGHEHMKKKGAMMRSKEDQDEQEDDDK
jgi:Spy/CpxP family protein refolding chaperone